MAEQHLQTLLLPVDSWALAPFEGALAGGYSLAAEISNTSSSSGGGGDDGAGGSAGRASSSSSSSVISTYSHREEPKLLEQFVKRNDRVLKL